MSEMTQYEKLANTANEVLTKAIEAATAGGQFLEEQLPLVVQELIMWKIVSGIFVFVIVAVGLAIFWRLVIKLEKDSSVDTMPFYIFGGIGSAFVAPFGFFVLYESIKWLVAPRVALIEYAASLVK